MTKEYIEIGKLTSTVGLRGELKVYPYTQDLHRFETLKTLYIEGVSYDVVKTTFVKSGVKVKLSGVDSVEDAKVLLNKEISITREDLDILPEGKFYIRDLIGLEVFSEDGKKIGKLKDVKQNTAQDLYVVSTGDKEIYIPGVEEFIKRISLEESKIVVHLIEGLIDYED